MKQSQFPFDEEARLKALEELSLLDTLPEPVFDEIVQRAAKACDAPISLLSLVDSRRQWYKARIGFALPELPRTIGFDGKTILLTEPLLVCNAQEDSLYANDPLVQSELNIRFYAGVPILTKEGLPLGALSVMDYRPRDLSPEQMSSLLEEAKNASEQLNKRRDALQIEKKKVAAAAADEERFVKPKREKTEPRAILPDVMLRFSADLRYIYVSPYAMETLGMKPDNLLGSIVGEERYTAPFASLLKPSLEKALQNRRVEEVLFYAPTPSGERLFQTLVMPEVSRGEVANILAIIRETEEEEAPETVFVEVPVEVIVEAPVVVPRPSLRSLLGIAITEADGTASMLQNCAEALAEYSEASSVRVWIRAAAFNRLSLEASAGSLTEAMPGTVGELSLTLPATATSLKEAAKFALEADAAGIETFKLVSQETFSLSAGNSLIGMVAIYSSRLMSVETRNEILEAIGVVAINLRRAQDNSELAQQSTFLARELMDIKLALQQESENSASIAHDMRTPLNSVLGFTNLLLGTELNSTQRELSEMTRTSAQALLDIVRGTLSQAKQPSGLPNLDAAAFDLRSLVEEVCEILAPNAQKKGLEIVVHCAPTLPSKLIGDRNKIRQILMNLGDNAIKFTSTGYVLMDINHDTILDNRVSVKIEVEDTGIGIAPEKIEHIFDRYVQADNTTDNPERGSGLGLSISREFATQMRGTLNAKSQLGDGSIFRLSLTLPIEEGAIPVSRREPGLEKLRVLIVDGSRLQQYALQEQIFAWGAEALLCPNAQEMLEALEFGMGKGRPFHLVLLDEKMSGYNYQTLSRTILNDPALIGTKLELIAAVGNRQAQNLQAEGIAGYLSKPVRSAPLKESLLAEALKLNGPVIEAPAAQEVASDSPPVELAAPAETIAAVATAAALPVAIAVEAEARKLEIKPETAPPVELAASPVSPLESVIAPIVESEDVEKSAQKEEVRQELPVENHSAHTHRDIDKEPVIDEAIIKATENEKEPHSDAERSAHEGHVRERDSEVRESTVVSHDSALAEKPKLEENSTDQKTEELPVRELLAQALTTPSGTVPRIPLNETEREGPVVSAPAITDMLGSLDSIPLPVIQNAIAEESASRAESMIATENADSSLEEDESKDPIPVNLEVEDIRLKALAVDDDSANLRLHQLMLESMHYVVDTAASGLEALDLFDTRVYDLILVDCQLNGIDGYQTVNMMRRREGGELRTCIIAVTGDVGASVKEKCLEAGMDACLIKPVSSEELEQCIDSIRDRELNDSEGATVAVEEEDEDDRAVGSIDALQMDDPEIAPPPPVKVATSTGVAFNLASLPGMAGAAACGDAVTETISKTDLIALRLAADKKNADILEAIEMNSIMDRKALLARVAGSSEVLQSLSNLCKVECARQVNDMRTSIGEGDRSAFLRATHKLRGMLMSLNATAAVEAVRKLELTANQGRPADAKLQMTVLEGELDRLQSAMESILTSMT